MEEFKSSGLPPQLGVHWIYLLPFPPAGRAGMEEGKSIPTLLAGMDLNSSIPYQSNFFHGSTTEATAWSLMVIIIAELSRRSIFTLKGFL